MSISYGDGTVETIAARVCPSGRIAAVRHVHAVVSGLRVAVVLLYGTERGKVTSIRFPVSPADVPPVVYAGRHGARTHRDARMRAHSVVGQTHLNPPAGWAVHVPQSTMRATSPRRPGTGRMMEPFGLDGGTITGQQPKAHAAA